MIKIVFVINVVLKVNSFHTFLSLVYLKLQSLPDVLYFYSPIHTLLFTHAHAHILLVNFIPIIS